VDKKKKKRKNKKKKNKQGSKLPTTAKHVGKKTVTVDLVGSVDDAKNTQTIQNPKYPCRLCKGSHILKDFSWSIQGYRSMVYTPSPNLVVSL
jgi:hypothetical protein